ncbi:glutathione transferase GstA [Paramagnetospirillum kuznetsovii]|uniref:Glutathione transferase GstA n=1 Tax=Paramagnetospirillum kuznetsovii TaxID=2053833 RepID=A0A364NYR1_9PROT|nr:glutathione transferase GstA [Paramagnetospirillum kuznetsovii]RAU22045.1 glutathione transferase GstA [Paramagnetospirillum kuznetsovii]
MKLYYKQGACSLSTHIALHESGLAFDIEAVDLVAKKTESGADFLAINPKGYIPALVLDDGTTLTEGVAIALAIAAMAPNKNLAPAASTPQYLKLVEWMIFIATELHKTTGAQFNPAMPDEGKAALKTVLVRRLDYADKAVGNGPFVMGETFTVADGYLFTVFSWLPRIGMDVSAWPNLVAHSARVKARPGVQAALKAEKLI